MIINIGISWCAGTLGYLDYSDWSYILHEINTALGEVLNSCSTWRIALLQGKQRWMIRSSNECERNVACGGIYA